MLMFQTNMHTLLGKQEQHGVTLFLTLILLFVSKFTFNKCEDGYMDQWEYAKKI